MVNEEWPSIQSDLDSGRLSPLGLVTDNISTCHQVLAHGYDLDDQGNLTIYCYDPNEPSQDGIATLSLNISKSYNTIHIQSPDISSHDDPPSNPTIKGFFRSSYSSVHAAATLIGPLAIGEIPPSAQALQPLAPNWNAWESPFSSNLLANGLTIQTQSNPPSGPYTALAAANLASTPSICSWGPGRVDLFIQDQNGFVDQTSIPRAPQNSSSAARNVTSALSQDPSRCVSKPTRVVPRARSPSRAAAFSPMPRWSCQTPAS